MATQTEDVASRQSTNSAMHEEKRKVVDLSASGIDRQQQQSVSSLKALWEQLGDRNSERTQLELELNKEKGRKEREQEEKKLETLREEKKQEEKKDELQGDAKKETKDKKIEDKKEVSAIAARKLGASQAEIAASENTPPTQQKKSSCGYTLTFYYFPGANRFLDLDGLLASGHISTEVCADNGETFYSAPNGPGNNPLMYGSSQTKALSRRLFGRDAMEFGTDRIAKVSIHIDGDYEDFKNQYELISNKYIDYSLRYRNCAHLALEIAKIAGIVPSDSKPSGWRGNYLAAPRAVLELILKSVDPEKASERMKKVYEAANDPEKTGEEKVDPRVSISGLSRYTWNGIVLREIGIRDNLNQAIGNLCNFLDQQEGLARARKDDDELKKIKDKRQTIEGMKKIRDELSEEVKFYEEEEGVIHRGLVSAVNTIRLDPDIVDADYQILQDILSEHERLCPEGNDDYLKLKIERERFVQELRSLVVLSGSGLDPTKSLSSKNCAQLKEVLREYDEKIAGVKKLDSQAREQRRLGRLNKKIIPALAKFDEMGKSINPKFAIRTRTRWERFCNWITNFGHRVTDTVRSIIVALGGNGDDAVNKEKKQKGKKECPPVPDLNFTFSAVEKMKQEQKRKMEKEKEALANALVNPTSKIKAPPLPSSQQHVA